MALRHFGYAPRMLFNATVEAEPALGGRAKPKPITGVLVGLSCSAFHIELMNRAKVVLKLPVGQ